MHEIVVCCLLLNTDDPPKSILGRLNVWEDSNGIIMCGMMVMVVYHSCFALTAKDSYLGKGGGGTFQYLG